MNPNNHAQRTILIAGADLTAVQSATLDTKGRGSWVSLVISFSAGINTSAVAPTISVAGSDDNTTFATITADKTIALAGTNIALQAYEIDMRGQKRYIKTTITPGTQATQDAVSIHEVATIHHLKDGPASTTDMVSVPDTTVVGSVVVI